MIVSSKSIGLHIANFRKHASISQESLSEMLMISRKHLSQIEIGQKLPSLELLIEIANALHVSADDLLVDNLEYSASSANTKLHQLLLDCNKAEEDIIIRNAENLKQLLYAHSVR